MSPELQQQIQNLMGDNSQPNLVTTEMPSESDLGQYSSVSVLPKSDNNGLVEGKDYVTVGGQMFWPWELEGIMGKDGAFDAKAVNQFVESLPQKPTLKELSSLRDFANPPSSIREVSDLMAATLSPMEAGQVSKKEMDLYNKSLSMAEGGEVSREEMMMQAMEGEAEGQADPNEAIRSSIEELMMQASQAEDPAERDQYLHLAEAAEVGSQAPMGEMAIQLAQAGRGEDTALAHVRPGEVIIPPEAFEDPEFESLIEKKFEELNIDPSRMVVGVGIASLNPITGLEEFGFFKKLAKSVKKVVKKVVKPLAKVAQFIPGPWQPIAALANKAFTVYDVAKGRANPLSLLTVAGPGAVGGSIGQNISNITKAGGGSFFSGLGKGLMASGQGAVSGIGSLIRNPIGTFTGSAPGGGIPGLFKSATMSGEARLSDAEIVDQLRLTSTPDVAASIEMMQTQGVASGDILKNLGVSPASFFNPEGSGIATLNQGSAGAESFKPMPGESGADALKRIQSQLPPGSAEHTYVTEQMDLLSRGVGSPEEIFADLNRVFGSSSSGGQQQVGFLEGLFRGGGADGKGNYGVVGDVLGGLFSGSGSGSGSGLNLGGLGGAGVAAVLAKLAYDEAKNRRGVQLTPAMTMNKYGGYQMAKRDAAAAGEAAPDPIDYGLLPSPMPLLSGGRPTPEDSSYGFGESQNEMEVNNPQADPVTGMRYGGAVMPLQMRYGGMVPMAYAEGGNVATEDFKRKNGGINGEGTETSDDIPAMLSDGEFVMTGQAVRGAGSFDLQSDGGIITLTPNGGESREKGTQLMYEMMELFAEFADKPKTKRAKAA
jgi:hypothetical protein